MRLSKSNFYLFAEYQIRQCAQVMKKRNTDGWSITRKIDGGSEEES